MNPHLRLRFTTLPKLNVSRHCFLKKRKLNEVHKSLDEAAHENAQKTPRQLSVTVGDGP
jgi:hypothetical protein